MSVVMHIRFMGIIVWRYAARYEGRSAEGTEKDNRPRVLPIAVLYFSAPPPPPVARVRAKMYVLRERCSRQPASAVQS